MILDPEKELWWPHLSADEQAEYREAASAHRETSIGVAYSSAQKTTLMERARRRMKRAEGK